MIAGSVDASSLRSRCALLRSLHVPGTPLVLPNAWDVASAKAVAAAGFPVVATSSAGVAEALGYEDHEDAPADQMLAVAGRIAMATDVPVTVDAEAGYGMAPPDLIDRLIGAGVAGCNLEDTDHRVGRLVDVDRHAERLAAVRAAAEERDYGLVINARIDVFITRDDERPDSDLLDVAVARARAYLEAGAHCVYPILLSDEETIAAFVDTISAPVNILAQPEAPSIAQLAELGVARISFGPAIYRRAMDGVASILSDLEP